MKARLAAALSGIAVLAVAPSASASTALRVTHVYRRENGEFAQVGAPTAIRAWMSPTTAAPSPTAVAQRFVEPARTSPAA